MCFLDCTIFWLQNSHNFFNTANGPNSTLSVLGLAQDLGIFRLSQVLVPIGLPRVCQNENDRLVPVGGVAVVVFLLQFLGFCCFKIRIFVSVSLFNRFFFVSPRAPLFSLFSMNMIQTCQGNQVYNI